MEQEIEILCNGQKHRVRRGLTVQQFLELLEIRGRGVAVELNMQVVPRSLHSQRKLAEGDSLEVVTLVGGG